MQALGDVPVGGYTSYANSIVEAQHDLKINGNGATPDGYQRGNAQNIIVFLTDGAANAMASHGWLPAPPVTDGLPPFDAEFWGTTTQPDSNKNKPCDAGVNAAKWAKDQGTIIYVIGYGFTGGSNGENCGTGSSYTPATTLRNMATDSSTVYLTPENANLSDVFQQIAYDIRDRAGRLVPDGSN